VSAVVGKNSYCERKINEIKLASEGDRGWARVVGVGEDSSCTSISVIGFKSRGDNDPYAANGCSIRYANEIAERPGDRAAVIGCWRHRLSRREGITTPWYLHLLRDSRRPGTRELTSTLRVLELA